MDELIQTEKVFVTDADITELRKRNEARAHKMIEEMGSKWLLHPDNRVTRESFKAAKNRYKTQ